MLIFPMNEDTSVDGWSDRVDRMDDEREARHRRQELVTPEPLTGAGSDDDHCPGAHLLTVPLALMVVSSGIRDLLSEVSGAVAFGVDGEELDFLELDVPASPTLLVAPMTDALKSVSDDGFVTGSLDRGNMWEVVGYHLDEQTSQRLAARNIEIEQIYQEVVEIGLDWQARPINDISQSASRPI